MNGPVICHAAAIKYNQLLRIEEELWSSAYSPGVVLSYVSRAGSIISEYEVSDGIPLWKRIRSQQ